MISAATHLRCDVGIIRRPSSNFHPVSSSERILKNGKLVTKLEPITKLDFVIRSVENCKTNVFIFLWLLNTHIILTHGVGAYSVCDCTTFCVLLNIVRILSVVHGATRSMFSDMHSHRMWSDILRVTFAKTFLCFLRNREKVVSTMCLCRINAVYDYCTALHSVR